MRKIDAHLHFNCDHEEGLALLEDLDLRLLNVCIALDPENAWRTKSRVWYRELAREHPQRFAWCTAMDVPRFNDPAYVERTMPELDQDFEDGAVACKVWKNVGMVFKRPSGEFFMVDDPLLDPIFAHMEERRMPLLAHVGDPYASWQPLDDKNIYKTYFSRHPEYHMYGKPYHPSHEELMRSLDHVAEKHPGLTVVGAHMAGLAHDVDELAKRFERYPNMAADLSAPSRCAELAQQKIQKVRDFFITYQDRFIFGTDCIQETLSSASAEERRDSLNGLRNTVELGVKYFGSNERFSLRGRDLHGLDLPAGVVEKIFFTNALKWYPRLSWA